MGHASQPSSVTPGHEWFGEALQESSDLVLVLLPDTTVVWCNAAVALLGYRTSEVVGQSFAEFLHPDDLDRAAEVISLEQDGVFTKANPITPAMYRVRHADGTWMRLEVNASSAPDDGRLLVVARLSGDLVIHDRLLEAVTGGEPFEKQVSLVVELARWRHPVDGYAVSYLDDADERRWYTVNVPPSLHEVQSETGVPEWSTRVGEDPDLLEIGPALRAAATAADFVDCLASRVEDPAHPEGALLMIWTTLGGPTASGHRYAMANMRRALALVLQQRAQLTALERGVRVDPLTGLTSRARLMALLDEADADPDGARHAVLYVDLDGFKGVNDSLGHRRGDDVLREAARRLSAVVPPNAVLARMGGDEFVVLCAPGTTEQEATVLAQQVVDRFDVPLTVDGAEPGSAQEVTIGASVGVAVGGPGEPVDSVLDSADRALYRAKDLGRRRWASAPAHQDPSDGGEARR